MLKRITKEESQIIDLYRKIRDPYNKYLSAEYLRMNAKLDTGEEEQIPSALEKCDIVYTAFCLNCKDVEDTFPAEHHEKAIADLTELMKKDMFEAYYGGNKKVR